jgi:hypothetical protein
MITYYKLYCPNCKNEFARGMSQGRAKGFGPLAITCPYCEKPISTEKMCTEYNLLTNKAKAICNTGIFIMHGIGTMLLLFFCLYLYFIH